MMTKKIKYEFNIKILRYGQERPYGLSIYDYIIETEQPKSFVKDFCTSTLYPHSQTKKEWKPIWKSPSSYFYGYHTFEKIKDNKYNYRVFKPGCEEFLD